MTDGVLLLSGGPTAPDHDQARSATGALIDAARAYASGQSRPLLIEADDLPRHVVKELQLRVRLCSTRSTSWRSARYRRSYGPLSATRLRSSGMATLGHAKVGEPTSTREGPRIRLDTCALLVIRVVHYP